MRIHLEHVDFIHPDETAAGVIQVSGATTRDMVGFGFYLTESQAQVLCEQLQELLEERKKGARS